MRPDRKFVQSGSAVRCAAFALSLAAGLLLSGCDGTIYPPYRYKETVVVETPQGIRTGSTVVEVHWYKEGQSNPFNHGAIHGEYKGQAAMVDLPDGKTLFALLSSPGGHVWALGAYQRLAQLTPEETPRSYDPDNTDFDVQFRKAMALKGPQVMPPTHPGASPDTQVSSYPLMVTFKNLNDPASVLEVDPANLAASFGPGYRLKAIILEKTDDKISDNLKNRIVWLEDYRGRGARLNGSTSVAVGTNELSDNLGSGAFYFMGSC